MGVTIAAVWEDESAGRVARGTGGMIMVVTWRGYELG